MGDALSRFHPLVIGWFESRFGRPTDIQSRAWPRIASGEHVLITAPTGSGKTLTAFLWAINQLVTGEWQTGHTSVLYVSPLKALNNDIYRNLLAPLSELTSVFEQKGESFPPIRVGTRSGDTPPGDRRRMLRHPPEILITTPESLNLLLSSPGGRSIFCAVQSVILDEIHSVVPSKRGTHLITAVDRLAPLCGEFQRIGLSATIKPLEVVGRFMGGYRIQGDPRHPHYRLRPVEIIRSDELKQYDVRVKFPQAAARRIGQEGFWEPYVETFRRSIRSNRSTLFFTNSRRLSEKITMRINDGEEQPLGYAHHGSLSREIREEVERKLKAGDLRAIVATNSLEMGIDIGSLDEVILIQCPTSISSAIQRVGRAGHKVGEISRGSIYPTHGQDFLEAAVLAPGIISEKIEETRPVQCPLDVLAQVIVSMAGVEKWDLDALYAQIRSSFPYHQLSRQQFELTLNMLGGRYADTRIRELEPKAFIDRLDNSIVARKGALLTLYTSGGTIPDRAYFPLRHHETHALIGELDEEFVWEASLGQTFALGTQNWRIQQINHNEVLVSPAPAGAVATPFWKGEGNHRDFHFSMMVAQFLERADEDLERADFQEHLEQEYRMEPEAARQLINFLTEQKEATRCKLPHRHHLVIESVASGPGSSPGNQIAIHTVWGGRLNRPFAMALDAAWEARYGHRLEIYVADDCIVLLLPHQISGDELLSMVTSTNVESLLGERLEGSGYFGARFRECAGRALILSRGKPTERMPLWMSRLRSKKLLDAVSRYDDFPILLETWRTCLQDEFDLENLRRMLAELRSGVITVSEVSTSRPSPMAREVTWGQINRYMYMDDDSAASRTSHLRDDLLRDVVLNPALRPTIPRKLVQQFELKRKRLHPGYSPSSPIELLEWVKERLLIPSPEWDRLLTAVQNDHHSEMRAFLDPIAEKLVKIHPPDAEHALVVALETLPRVIEALYDRIDEVLPHTLAGQSIDGKDPFVNRPSQVEPGEATTSVLGGWLQFYGPTNMDSIQRTLGAPRSRLLPAFEGLVESQGVITGRLVAENGDSDLCDRENYEILLRLSRVEAVPVLEPLDVRCLPLFLATHQGLSDTQADKDGLYRCLDQLLCHPEDAELWETEIFPARLNRYDPSWLDTIMQEGDLRWIGCGDQQVALCFVADLDLMQEEPHLFSQDLLKVTDENKDEEKSFFPSAIGRYHFYDLLESSRLGPRELVERIWRAVWEGRITNDTFLALRRGIMNRFQAPEAERAKTQPARGGRRSKRRGGIVNRRGSAPFPGNWFRLPGPDPSDDLMEMEERNKERARLLLDRYGILFRELLRKELPPFRWAGVFRALRLMELSGEILAGCFFHGIPGLQFISLDAFRRLNRKLPEDRIFWLNASDPASLCGLHLEVVKGALPKRLKSTHLVYRGSRLVLTSKRNGKSLNIQAPPDDPDLHLYLAPLHHLLTREFQPLRRVVVEEINGDTPSGSPYIDAFRTQFDVVVDYKQATLYRSSRSWGTG